MRSMFVCVSGSENRTREQDTMFIAKAELKRIEGSKAALARMEGTRANLGISVVLLKQVHILKV